MRPVQPLEYHDDTVNDDDAEVVAGGCWCEQLDVALTIDAVEVLLDVAKLAPPSSSSSSSSFSRSSQSRSRRLACNQTSSWQRGLDVSRHLQQVSPAFFSFLPLSNAVRLLNVAFLRV